MRVYVTGGHGFLGSRVVSLLELAGHTVFKHKSDFVDIRDHEATILHFRNINAIDGIVHCAGVVGGMLDNAKHPAKYLADNLRMGLNVLDAAKEFGCKVVMAGSSCMYPSPCYGPYQPDTVWLGAPYHGNFGYGIAKRVVCEAAQAYRTEYGLDAFTCVLPNLYGPGADGSEAGHFVAGVVRKMRAAKEANVASVEMMGDGTACRELIYVDDAAKALIFALEKDLGPGPMNFGTNREHSIREVAETIKVLVGYDGQIEWGSYRDNGQQRKIMDSGRAHSLTWKPEVSLIEGLRRVVTGEGK